MDEDCAEDTNTSTTEKKSKDVVVFHDCDWTFESTPFSAETELRHHRVLCSKNPGHLDFIPMKDFHIGHLPVPYRTDDILDWIKICADLTVRLCTTATSSSRPDLFPDTEIGKNEAGYQQMVGRPYPFSKWKNQPIQRIGTGRIKGLARANRDVKWLTGPCRCTDECEVMGWILLEVWTARHVVFDDLEAQATDVDLFYDSDDDKEAGLSKTVKAWKTFDASTERDTCKIYCVTHDTSLADRLEQDFKRLDQLWKAVGTESVPISVVPPGVIIISHPHGCAKTVTVGSEVNVYSHHDSDSSVVYYTTPTCPGSSGAAVWAWGLGAWGYHAHSGSLADGMGRSGAWI